MNFDRVSVVATVGAVALVVLLLLLPTMLYVVDERELAVVLQFGQPVAERTEPGWYLKLPLLQEVRKLPKTRQFWGDTPDFALPDLPTRDDKKIEIIPWAVWRVTEPTVVVQRLRTMENAEQRIAQFVRGAMRDVITRYDLIELVRSTDREMRVTVAPEMDQEGSPAADAGSVDLEGVEGVEMERIDDGTEIPRATLKILIRHGRKKILDEIRQLAQQRLSAGAGDDGALRGIELIDLGISQIQFVESVRSKTFDRWIAEREAISAANVNEGERRKQEIINRAAAQVERIQGEGQQKANELRGAVDAEIIRKYAQAIEEAGDFFTFIRTLETYKKVIRRDTRLILTTDSELFQLLKRLDEPQSSSALRAE